MAATNSSAPTKACWATLLTKTSYVQGALVVAASLAKVKSQYPLVVFATKELPQEARDVLTHKGIAVRDIEYLEPKEQIQLSDHDARFHDTWTKLRAFELVEYSRVVLMDSDMLVLRNMDELMTMPLQSDWIAASHACTCNPRKLAHYPDDWIPENCGHTLAKLTTPLAPSELSKRTHHLLNSGLVVLQPSLHPFQQMKNLLYNEPELVSTFKFPDQDLLAHVFKGRFLPLSYRYNALKTLRACHSEMWRDEDVKNVHYILDKPWAKRVEKGDPNAETHSWWWQAWEEVEANWGDTPHKELVLKCVAPKIQ